MTTMKATKRALLSSVVALFLCFAMLLGTTYAWFTDTVKSANNIITSGNLDVKLEYWDGSKYAEVTSTTKLFNDAALWEPGHTEVAYLKVSNAGSLALKYQLNVNVYDETPGKTVDGEDIWLSQHLVFNVVEKQINTAADLYTREGAMTAAGTTKGLKTYNGETTPLLDGEADYVALIIYMPTDVNNAANHNGVDIPSIEMGVNVLATQYANEVDGFKTPDYDEDAWMEEMLVFTAADLQAALKKGGKVTLADDVDLTETITVPASNAAGFSRRNVAPATVLNLNGKKITGSLTRDEGALIVNNGTLVINGDANSLIQNTEVNGSSVIYNYGVLTLNGGTYVGAPSDISNGKYASYAINTAGATAELTVNNANISGRGAIGATNGAKVTLNGGTYHTPEVAWGHAVYAVNDGTEVIINDGIFSEGYEMAANNYGMYQIYSGDKAKVTVYGGTFMPWDCANGYDLCTATDGVIEIYGGSFADDPTDHLADGYKAINNGDGTYSIKFPQESFDSLIDNAQPGDTVEVPVGSFTMSGNNELVIVGSGEDTVITIDGSIENANISNATITGEPRIAVKAGQEAVFNNVTFDGAKAWGSVQGTAEFTGCTFNGLLHFDSSAETTTIKFVDCTFGEYSIIKLGGKADYVLENCVIKTLAADATGAWGKEWLITYCDTTFTDCKIGRVIRAGSSINITLNNCVDGADIAVTEKIVHMNADPNVIINGIAYTRSSAALITAIANGKTEIHLTDGNYTMPDGSDISLTGKALTIMGSKNAIIDATGIDERDQFVTGANLTFDGVTLNFGTVNYMGFANCATLTYKNCDINGLQFAYGAGTTTFVGCNLNSNGAEHCVWTWGGQNISFTDCDFTYGDRAVNCYGEGVTTNVSFTDCTFTKVAGKDTTGAIETNSSTLTALNLTIKNCTVNEGELWFVPSWDSLGGIKTHVLLDEKVTVATAKQLAAVVAENDTVYLMSGEYDLNGIQKDGLKLIGLTDNVKMANTTKYASGKSTGAIWQKITLENMTITDTVYTMADGGQSTFNNVTFAAGFRQGYGTGVTFNYCTFGSNSEGYALHFQTDSASEGGKIILNGCTFEGGKVHLGGKRSYEFTNCEFAAGTDFQVWSNITLTNCTVNGVVVTAANMATLFPNLDATKVTLA